MDKKAQREYDRKRYLQKKEFLLLQHKEWRKKHGKEFEKARYVRNREKRLELSHRCYEKNREKRIAKAKEYRKNHREIFRKAEKKYLAKPDTKLKLDSRSRANHSKIKKDKCQACGTKEILEYHHEDYINDKIIILCIFCHKKLHRRGLSSIGLSL